MTVMCNLYGQPRDCGDNMVTRMACIELCDLDQPRRGERNNSLLINSLSNKTPRSRTTVDGFTVTSPIERLQSTLASLIRLACEPNQAISVLASLSCNQRDKRQSFTSDTLSLSRLNAE